VTEGEIPVETLRLKPTSFEDAFLSSGRIEPEEQAIISAEVAGVILQMDYDVGDEIKKGQIVVRLDDASW
jgi:multidrug efflux pump subunit AcrA (membrane-fusion protein)